MDGRGPAPGAVPGGFGRREGLLVFLLALIPRLAHAFYLRGSPLASEFVPDLQVYLDVTSRLMHGSFFLRELMVMSPGYPLLLAPLYILFGPQVWLFVLQNALLDAGSAALCGVLAARLAPSDRPGLARAGGLCAGVLYALCGQLLFYALLPLSEGPCVFFFLLGLALLFRRGEGPALLSPWLAGACLALSALLRPNMLLGALAGLCVWSLAPVPNGVGARRLRLAAGARSFVALLLVFAPFMLHNHLTSGRLSPFGLQGGMTLYGGTHPGASGVGDLIPGCGETPYAQVANAILEASRRTGRELSPSEADAYWYGQVARYFRESPGEAARLLGRKALLLVNNTGLDSTADMAFWARVSPLPGLLPLPVGLVFALALLGLWRCAPRGPEALALAAALLAMAGAALFFHVTPRYRVVLLPLALVFAGAGLALWLPELAGALRGSARAARRRFLLGLAAPLALAGLILGLSLIPLERLVQKPPPAALEHARLARYRLLTGGYAAAVAEYAAALATPGLRSGQPELAAALAAEEAAARRMAGGKTSAAPPAE